MTLRLGYMTAFYPRATDTFIQREVSALRGHGVEVQTFALRKPAEKEIVGPEQQAERERTFYVLPPCPLDLLRCHASQLLRSPRRYFSALRSAVSIRGMGLKSLALQFAYFAEAGILAHQFRKRGLTHLHNHFFGAPATVAMLAAEIGGFTYSLTLHGPSEFFAPDFWRMDEKVRRSTFVACISHFCRSQVMAFSRQQDWDKLHIVHCGVEPELFTPVRHQGEGHRLLFVGRLAALKGLPVLLESVAQLKRRRPDVMLTVAGDGPDRAALEAQVQRLNIAGNVTFVGYQSQQQVRALLAQADVFVMSSFAEGVPVVLMEAMAAGVPVVATRIAGIPELVEDGVGGLLVPPGDAVLLAEKVEQLLATPELRAALSARGREKVEREFDIHKEAEKLSQIMTEALEGTAEPRETRPTPLAVSESGRALVCETASGGSA